GVLVVQTVEPRVFSPSEIRMLVTVAAQVAPLVGDAHLLEMVAEVAHGEPTVSKVPASFALHGVALSPGRGLGEAYVVDGFDEWRRNLPLRSSDPAREKERLDRALVAAHE